MLEPGRNALFRLLGATLPAACLPTAAGCLGDLQAAALVANCMDNKPAANPEGLSTVDGECSRARFSGFLAQPIGDQVVGYKAGLTNPAVQERFNATAPVWGVLYAPMQAAEGAIFDAAFNAAFDAAFDARPLFEADLLVRVSSPRINQAKAAEQVLQQNDRVIPAIELPDLVVQAPSRLNGAAIAANPTASVSSS